MYDCWLKDQAKERCFKRKRKRAWYVRGRRGDCFKPSRVAKPCKRLPVIFGLSSRKTRLAPEAKDQIMRFDTDSFLMAVDTGGSYCMTNNCNDFIPGTIEEAYAPIDGIGTTVARKKGTVKWRILDDDGKTFEFTIPGVFFVPTLSTRLFSPQHWAKINKGQGKGWRGLEKVDDEELVMSWDNKKHRRTVRIHPRHNIFFMQSAPAFRAYKAFIDEAQHQPGDELMGCKCFPATADQQLQYVTDDEGEDDESCEQESNNTDKQPLTNQGAPDNRERTFSSEGENEDPGKTVSEGAQATQTKDGETIADQDGAAVSRTGPMRFSFHDEGEARNQEQAQPDGELTSDKAELFRWHYRLSHMPFQKMKLLARQGLLPRKFADCRVPHCPACIYGKMTRRPKRTKATPNKIQPVMVEGPGDCVSVDQMERYTPGFVAQLKGFLTHTRYTAATVYTDHYSRLSRVYMQTNLSEAENLKLKHSRFCGTAQGVPHSHPIHGGDCVY